MEDLRDQLVVVAGYILEMEQFLESNPELRSRFNTFIHFGCYEAEELVDIFKRYCAQYGYSLDPQALQALDHVVTTLHQEKSNHFGNAREIRNLFEKAWPGMPTALEP